MLSASWECYLLNNEIKCKYTLEKDKTGTEPTVFLLWGEQLERTEYNTLLLHDLDMGEVEGAGKPTDLQSDRGPGHLTPFSRPPWDSQTELAPDSPCPCLPATELGAFWKGRWPPLVFNKGERLKSTSWSVSFCIVLCFSQQLEWFRENTNFSTLLKRPHRVPFLQAKSKPPGIYGS